MKENTRLTLVRLLLLPYKFLVSFGILIFLISNSINLENSPRYEIYPYVWLIFGILILSIYHINFESCTRDYKLKIFDVFGDFPRMYPKMIFLKEVVSASRPRKIVLKDYGCIEVDYCHGPIFVKCPFLFVEQLKLIIWILKL